MSARTDALAMVREWRAHTPTPSVIPTADALDLVIRGLEDDDADEAVMHLIEELRGSLEVVEAERDRLKRKVTQLTARLAAGVMAVHSDPDPV